MRKEMNYDEKVKIVKFKNALTVKDALIWAKSISVDSAKDGWIELGNCSYLEGWKKDYNAIFNKISPAGIKIYKNSTRDWYWKRFANQKVDCLVMITYETGYFIQYLADSYALDKLMKQIDDGKKFGKRSYLIQMTEINIGE